ncbi:MAG: diversity-generating retroelement protein bAvd family protein [Bacteroidetes bacterium HGW-Bacteroidetes-13]|nr:MAG: diversity-generating retroelement protein bAvd family protein [Bacteroidetes bacterium HGW-Bacteroidetes-13]
MKRHNFKNLKIWQESMTLVSETYEIVTKFPEFERFGLVSQLTRCAVSIPSNIAEGSSKSSNKHFKTFIETSLGSAFEWQTQIIIAQNRNYINKEDFINLESKILQLQKMISKFLSHLDSDI